MNYKPCSKVELKELLFDQIRRQQTTFVERQCEEIMVPNQDIMPPRHSGRVIRPPVCYKEIGEAQVNVSNNEQDDPLIYQHAIEESDKMK